MEQPTVSSAFRARKGDGLLQRRPLLTVYLVGTVCLFLAGWTDDANLFEQIANAALRGFAAFVMSAIITAVAAQFLSLPQRIEELLPFALVFGFAATLLGDRARAMEHMELRNCIESTEFERGASVEAIVEFCITEYVEEDDYPEIDF